MKRTIERIVTYAVQVAEPEMIILFGSMTNGTHNAHSDIDLLIILDRSISGGQIAQQIKYYAQDFAISADVLVHSKHDVEKAQEFPDSFLSGVLKSGEIVYIKH